MAALEWAYGRAHIASLGGGPTRRPRVRYAQKSSRDLGMDRRPVRRCVRRGGAPEMMFRTR
jgi:hypothetical protein